jgi:hypothetical protein
VDFADECAHVWRGQIERFHPKNVIQHDRYGDGSIMIWCGLSHLWQNKPRENK